MTARKVIDVAKSCFALLGVKQLSAFLFFLMLSTAFWFMVVLKENGTAELAVPLTMKNVPENVIVTTDLPSDIHCVMSGRNHLLLRYKYIDPLKPVEIDFSAYAGTNGRGVVSQKELLRLITQQLPKEIKAELKSETLEFYYNYGEKKRIPVRMTGLPKTGADCYVAATTLSPDSVIVFAPRAQLDTIRAAWLRPVVKDALTETTTLELALNPPKGARYSMRSVSIMYEIDRLVEKKLSVVIGQENFPSGMQLRTFPSKAEITFLVGMNHYRTIDEEDFRIVVDYNMLPSDGEKRCRLQLKSCPPQIDRRRVTIQPKEVEYLIEELTAS